MPDPSIVFKGWQKTSLIEYPGRIATVLFTGGCNFRCPFCYNPRLILEPSSLPDLAAETVLSYLGENRSLYQAVMVTGGEPTLHEGLAGFFGQVRELGLLGGLETNGSNPGLLAELLRRRLVNFVGMDVKASLEFGAYRRAAGLEEKDLPLFERLKQSLSLLQSATIDYELRCTVVPDLHSEQDILTLAGQLKGARRFVLQQFVPGDTLDSVCGRRKPFLQEALEGLQRQIQGLFGSCELRGL